MQRPQMAAQIQQPTYRPNPTLMPTRPNIVEQAYVASEFQKDIDEYKQEHQTALYIFSLLLIIVVVTILILCYTYYSKQVGAQSNLPIDLYEFINGQQS